MHEPGWSVIMLFIGLVFLGVGLFIRLTPAERLLEGDARTGKYLYKKKLEETGDEGQAIEAAGSFYRDFGLLFAIIGALMIVIALVFIIF